MEIISAGMYEREEIIAVALLGALCGQNTFLFGPPGTAKSLISRRIACAFKEPTYFEYLMNRFSTPEEVYGPVSIKALKKDEYIRKTDNYLPTAEFAFLDEIWKSSPAILNTLLTMINERIFRNGDEVEQTPLKALIAASNETPEPNQGLEALYDRFVIRLMVAPIDKKDHFERLLSDKPNDAYVRVPKALVIGEREWNNWREKLHDVKMSSETLAIIDLIRQALEKDEDNLHVYVSDRRWQRAAILMKASAFFNGRQTTNHSDAWMLEYCLWTHEKNRQAVAIMVAQAIRNTGFQHGVNLSALVRQREILEKEISDQLFYTADVYEVTDVDGIPHFLCEAIFPKSQGDTIYPLYIPTDEVDASKIFYPVDKSGRDQKRFRCLFDGNETYIVSFFGMLSAVENYEFHPKVLFYRGDKKQDINPQIKQSLVDAINTNKSQLSDALGVVEQRLSQYKNTLASPFITPEKAQIAINGINEQIDSLKLQIKDCQRLEALCR